MRSGLGLEQGFGPEKPDLSGNEAQAEEVGTCSSTSCPEHLALREGLALCAAPQVGVAPSPVPLVTVPDT